jgi:hypothetical protein
MKALAIAQHQTLATEVRFLCLIPGRAAPVETVFELGMGPCGRVVEDLAYAVGDGLLVISQGSRGSEPDDYQLKNFIYKMDDVRGRIVTIE